MIGNALPSAVELLKPVKVKGHFASFGAIELDCFLLLSTSCCCLRYIEVQAATQRLSALSPTLCCGMLKSYLAELQKPTEHCLRF